MTNFKEKVFFVVGLFLVPCVVASSATAAVLKVPAEHATVSKALEAAAAGDTVKVSAGTYNEHIILKQGVILEGGWSKDFASRDTASFETILDGALEKGPVVLCADDAVLDGFTVIHGSLDGDGDSGGSGIYCEGTSPVIRNNIVRNNEPSGIFCSKSAAVVENNRIHDNPQAGIYVQKGSDLKIRGNDIWNNGYSAVGTGKEPVSKFEVIDNILHNNQRSGVNAGTATGIVKNNLIYENGWSGVRCVPMPMIIVNNTIDSNSRPGVIVEDPDAVAVIKNNIISNNIDGGIRTSGEGYEHNLLFANGETGDCDPRLLWCVKPQFGGYGDETSYLKTKNIIADPMFRDREAHDYHLQPGSPAIDSGDKDKEYNDVNFPSSMGTELNDIGYYGGPLAPREERTGNARPKAVIEGESEVFAGRMVKLDGQNSLDPDGDALSYQWEILEKPAGSAAKFRKADRNRTGFKVDKSGTYRVQLVVTDSMGLSSEPEVITVSVPDNQKPAAIIGEILTQMAAGDTLTVYGNSSKDPEEAPLTYKWSLIYKPDNSKTDLVTRNESCSFLIDIDGSYTVQLIVNDGALDSDPVSVNISTKKAVDAGVRRVPEEYPTIQAALDAASPGDNIIVQKGRYQEMLVIDKSVNLIGKDWPTIDGGSEDGNKNTIAIFYLGDRAGKVEGFIITGGGSGDLGHGVNIWDSSPDIFNNRITGNNHGMGIHGSPALTSKTKVHGNHIYDNHVGVGNGKDSTAHIYNNRIYDNKIVGIGVRGKAGPRVEGNYIYGNRLGVGAREVGSPRIENNHIFANTDGIVISPLSTIKRFAFDDIYIQNNLIVNNDHIGINVTSFNMSKVFVRNNTIDANNKGKRKIRGGGLVLGYPQPANFTAVVENNIISNNLVGGIVKYIGPELFQKPGADLQNSRNNLWNNTVNYLDCQAGDGAMAEAPFFDGGPADDMAARYLAGSGGESGYQYKKENFSELPAEL